MRFRVRFQDPDRDTENLIECDTVDEAHLAHNAIRHCIHCLRYMGYKKAGEKDPANSWRTVCRPCLAQGKRLGTGQGAAQETRT